MLKDCIFHIIPSFEVMAGNKNFFSILKSLFISDANSRGKKDKRRRRWVVRLLKMKQQPPLSAPSPSPSPSPLRESPTSEPRGHAVSLIVVTDTPDELPCKIQSPHQYKDNMQLSNQQHLAATKIQAAFHRYLARKALRALKGVVKLQAIIRGCAVRRQAMNTLKCLQSIVSIQSQVCSKRCETSMHQEYIRDIPENDIKVDLNSQKRWDDSTLTKEELKAHFLSKRDASLKRERIKEYYLSHRRSAETERDKVYGRRRYWLEQWVDSQLAKRENLGNPITTLSARKRDENLAKTSDSASCVPRRSYNHRKQHSTGDDDNSFRGSPLVPTYMASTTSAKAKARSLSSPRLRPISFDVCSDITSPYKHKLSPISSINSELTISSNWIGSSFKSARLRGSPSSVKSTMSTKDFRLHGIYYQNGIRLSATEDPNLVID